MYKCRHSKDLKNILHPNLPGNSGTKPGHMVWNQTTWYETRPHDTKLDHILWNQATWYETRPHGIKPGHMIQNQTTCYETRPHGMKPGYITNEVFATNLLSCEFLFLTFDLYYIKVLAQLVADILKIIDNLSVL